MKRQDINNQGKEQEKREGSRDKEKMNREGKD
jgi:hypothetical protein